MALNEILFPLKLELRELGLWDGFKAKTKRSKAISSQIKGILFEVDDIILITKSLSNHTISSFKKEEVIIRMAINLLHYDPHSFSGAFKREELDYLKFNLFPFQSFKTNLIFIPNFKPKAHFLKVLDHCDFVWATGFKDAFSIIIFESYIIANRECKEHFQVFILQKVFFVVTSWNGVREVFFLVFMVINKDLVHYHYVLRYGTCLITQNDLNFPQIIHQGLVLGYDLWNLLISHYLLSISYPSNH